MPCTRLKAFAHVLDFFGGMFEIRNGKAVVPGGQRSPAGLGRLAGARPDKGAAFFEKLTDQGRWLAGQPTTMRWPASTARSRIT